MRSKTSQLLQGIYLSFLGLMACGSCANAASIPAFVDDSIYTPNKAVVSAIEPTLAADLVVLNGGLEHGMRPGMVCRVLRDAQSMGEIIIIESTSDRSAGLILNLTNGNSLKTGDVACVKTLQNS